jgi:hypothetical protein
MADSAKVLRMGIKIAIITPHVYPWQGGKTHDAKNRYTESERSERVRFRWDY